VSQQISPSPSWRQATTLAERIPSLSVAALEKMQGIDSSQATRRLDRWRSQTPFSNDTYFTQRLELDGLTEQTLLYLLGEPVEALHHRLANDPPWLAEFLTSLSHSGVEQSETVEKKKVIDAGGFLEILSPVVKRSEARLNEKLLSSIGDRTDLPFTLAALQPHLKAHVYTQLLRMINRTMVLELNVARMQGYLSGETPEERFGSFLERIKVPEHRLALFEEYPVLARQVVTCLNHWMSFSVEFIEHLIEDWTEIRELFSPDDDPGVITEIKVGAGDSHRQGRSVVVVKFSSGFQIVYKPRTLAVDIEFQKLLTWLNQRGDHPPFRTLKILNRETHGWVEFVKAQDCSSEEGITRFYQRQGGYLALLYALQAVDFHFENLIASGEHPVLIDLESLFHQQSAEFETKHSDQIAWDHFNRSVLRVGLLPQRIWLNADNEGIDVSGLGGTAGQLSPQPVPYWESAGTDQMHVARKRIEIPGGQNRPTWAGGEVNLLNYSEALVQGFASVYHTLLRHRRELLAENGPLASFGDVEVRVILRPTKVYAQLLNEGYHPNMLRNALDRDRFFDRLWVDIERQPNLARVFPAERRDLQGGDVPMFTTVPSSPDLFDSAGERVPDFFAQTGMNLVRQRVQELGEEDFARQEWFIRGSLTSLSIGTEYAKHRTYKLQDPRSRADRERLLAAACRIGDHLGSLALRGEDDATWLGVTLINDRNWALMPLGIDLYSGLTGVILYLAYLEKLTQDQRYDTLARAAFKTFKRQLELHKVSRTVGGFGGSGGLIHTFMHLSVLWEQPALLDEIESIIETLPEIIDEDQELDIIGGAAGCLISLINFYKLAPSERTLAAAIRCGDHLLAKALRMDHGIAWRNGLPASAPLAGFSHGAAGIAWALSSLAELTGEERYRTGAMEAVEYERSVYSAEYENWPDMRDFERFRQQKDEGLHYPVTWCHGAPGVGMGRLLMLQQHPDSEMRAEVEAAIRTTIKSGFGLNHSLCHGDLGNLELLMLAAETFDDPELSSHVDRLAASILENIEDHGWTTGIPSGVESPGLMTGLAGIGYGLLRLVDPVRVPSVMVLAPAPN
jgi:type 2 lantibiotic biosynthesis protein LanM